MASSMNLNRRLVLGGLLLGAAHPSLGATIPKARRYPSRVRTLLRRSLVVDMLGPLSINGSVLEALYTDPAAFGAQRIADLRSSGISVFHHAMNIEGSSAHEDALQYFASWNRFASHYANDVLLVTTADDFYRAKNEGRIGLLLGVQNSDHFRAPEDVDLFYGLGQRVSLITYNARNRLGDGATERAAGGLSQFGAEIVERMNNVGMVVDVSHSGDRTVMDTIEASKGPVIISHSNCRALVPNHPRCMPDEAIRKLAARGGVIGITGVRMFVRDREPTTIEHVVDHVDHVVKLVGIEHVGIGTDTDIYGYDKLPADQLGPLKNAYAASYGFRQRIDIEGLDHPMKFYDLTSALMRRGYSEQEISLIIGGNFARVLSVIWNK